MHLVIKLNRRTKSISWFLIHILAAQLIPLQLVAKQEKSNHYLTDQASLKKKKTGTTIARLILNWSESNNQELELSATESNKSMQAYPKKTIKINLTASSNGSGGGYSPASATQFVDPFTGDFSYSIPLIDVEGYPLVLNYNSNVTMTSEASWVGLGWNLDVGSVNREMRGIPDEFNGSQSVTRTYNKLDDETEGLFKQSLYE